MTKLLALVTLVVLAIAPAMAEDFEDFTKQERTSATEFAKKHTMPGPVVPPLPEPPRFVRPDPKVTAGDRLSEGLAASRGLERGVPVPSSTDVGAAKMSGISAPRSAASASSPRLDAQRSLKRLIRSLG